MKRINRKGFKNQYVVIVLSLVLVLAYVFFILRQDEPQYTYAELLECMQGEDIVIALGYPYTDDGVGGAPRFMEMMLQKLLNDMEYKEVTEKPEAKPLLDIAYYIKDGEKTKLSLFCNLKTYEESVFLEYAGGVVKYENEKLKAVVEAMPYVAPIITDNMIAPELEESIISTNVIFGINEKGVLSDEIVKERISQRCKDNWGVLEETLHDELLHSLAQAEKGELFIGELEGESVYYWIFDRYAIMGYGKQVYYYEQAQDTIPVATEDNNLLEYTEGRSYYCFDTESVGEYNIKLESDYVCQYQDKCYVADWRIGLYFGEDRVSTEAIYSVNQTQAGFAVEPDMFEEYMKVYTMEQDGTKYPLIIFQYSYEGENETTLYERSFYTVKDNQVLLFHEPLAESNKSPIAMQCNKEYIVNEAERSIADEQGIYTFDFLNLLITEECAYPKYFLSIIEELETSHDVYMQTIAPPITTYWDEGVTGGGKYEDAKFSCYIDGETYSFDGNDLLSDTEKWDWDVIGIYPDEIANKTYIILHHFDVESETIENPALILLEFTTNNPSEYTMYPYETSDLLYWVRTCYRIENNIYIATENDLVSIDLNTKELRFCEEEKNCVNDLVKEFYAQTSYEMYQFRATLQQGDTVVYSAFISEAFDDMPVGLVAVAWEKGEPIAYMIVDLTEGDIRENKKQTVIFLTSPW